MGPPQGHTRHPGGVTSSWAVTHPACGGHTRRCGVWADKGGRQPGRQLGTGAGAMRLCVCLCAVCVMVEGRRMVWARRGVVGSRSDGLIRNRQRRPNGRAARGAFLLFVCVPTRLAGHPRPSTRGGCGAPPSFVSRAHRSLVVLLSPVSPPPPPKIPTEHRKAHPQTFWARRHTRGHPRAVAQSTPTVVATMDSPGASPRFTLSGPHHVHLAEGGSGEGQGTFFGLAQFVLLLPAPNPHENRPRRPPAHPSHPHPQPYPQAPPPTCT